MLRRVKLLMRCTNVLTWELNRYGRWTTDDRRHTLNLSIVLNIVSLYQLGPLSKFWLWFVGRIDSYCFLYGFSMYWFLRTYVHRVYCGHVCLPTRRELQEPNHPRDVIGLHRGISIDLLLVQRI